MGENKEKEAFPVPEKPTVKRVAAYARVSTGKDAMLHSRSAQDSYYGSLIQKHPGWVCAGVYSDEAQSGIKANRPGFQKMLSDCRTGKIDMIITKSISRFTRNSAVFFETVRELQELGIDVFFEDENVHTLSGKEGLLFALISSIHMRER